MPLMELLLIGIGTGSSDHLTAGGRRAILEADAILLPEKAGERAALAAVRRRLLAEVRPDAPVIPFDMPDREGDRLEVGAVA
ncbi:MAG: SAM-dependent methyltransferase, partial [Pseudomonadota bacterium]